MTKADPVLPSESQSATCHGCGLKTNSPELLQSVRKSFRRKRVLLCYSCKADSLKYAQRTNWAFLLVILLLGMAGAVATGEYQGLWQTMQLLVALVVISPITVLLHELGHAIMARLVGFKVYSILLGMGKLLWQGRVGDILLQIRFIQMGGGVTSAPEHYGRWFPLQWFLICLAGPLANLLGAFAAFAGLVIYGLFYEVENDITMLVFAIWVFFNLFLFVTNLIPFKMSMYGLTLGSDGLQLVWALFRPKFLRARHEYSRPIMRFAVYRQLGELERARQVMVEAREKAPDDLMVLLNLSAVENECGNHEAAVEIARAGLQAMRDGVPIPPAVAGSGSHLLPKFFEAGLKDNLACALLEERGSDLSEALTLAQEAYETVPFSPEVRASYGYALGITGHAEEGLALLQKAAKKLSDQPDHVKARLHKWTAEVAAMAEAGTDILPARGATLGT